MAPNQVTVVGYRIQSGDLKRIARLIDVSVGDVHVIGATTPR